MSGPLAIDLYCGLGGWTEALLDLGYRVVGYDIEAHEYGEHRYPGELVLADVLTLGGAQFKDAALIVASPPCTEYSYMAMPWTRAKQIARALRGEDEFPEGYTGSRTIEELNALFDACFRVQREASEAAGHHIPMVVENVRGAIPWVGRSRWNFGSFHLWGDVPALMPPTFKGFKSSGMNWSDRSKRGQDSWFNIGSPGQKKTGCNPIHALASRQPSDGIKNGGDWFGSGPDCSLQRRYSGTKQPGISGRRANGKGDRWFQDGAARSGSKSESRKAASAMIAKIPYPLAEHIGRTYWPRPMTASPRTQMKARQPYSPPLDDVMTEKD